MKTIGNIFCLTLILAGALVHGATTQRWATLTPRPEFSNQLHSYIVQFGDTQAENIPNDMPVKEKSIATSHRYVSTSQQFSAIVTLISGPPGAVATHTPDVCYPASGYQTLRGPIKETLELPGGGRADYYYADFEKKSATKTERVRVRWCWSADGLWAAPERPRFEYINIEELAKIYIITTIPDYDAEDVSHDNQVTKQFVTATLTQYAELFPAR